ncbi:MAG: amylo-alpha-1,6-glucosidase [Rhizobiales bacterium]|nr:amylo-alpha-1,6-glucosidase [Hyphomicrobiales bacterium]
MRALTRHDAAAAEDVDSGPELPFYIPARTAPPRPRRSLKHDDTFVVLDAHGDIGLSPDGADGVFHCDTRHVSRLELLINGMQPLLLGSSLRDDNAMLRVDLTNPDIYFENRLSLPKDTLHFNRAIFVWRGNVYQRCRVTNYGDHKVSIHLSWTFGADFADLFEVRGLRRERRGRTHIQIDSAQAHLSYDGLDGVTRRTVIALDPEPDFLDRGVGTYSLQLGPGQRCSLFLSVECDPESDSRPMPFLRGLRAAFRDARGPGRSGTSVRTSNPLFNEILCRAAADLRMLTTATSAGPYPYAGIPWYSTTFGRDGLITALQMLWCDPDIARGVLRRLAAYQAQVDDPYRDAQPGKILHEMRSGEMAALGEIPFGLYYGSVDSTPLFVLLAGLYVQRTGDIETLKALWPNIVAALQWIDGPGDIDRDGFVEYYRATEHGLVNQGWKDSQDAVFHHDGRLADGPIALAEVQGYVYAAKRLAARCANLLGDREIAKRLEREAEDLAARFDDAFWCPDIGTYALALDGEKRPCAVRTSNAGQVLFTGIASPSRAEMIGRQLLGPSFFNGWGIRTVANDQPRYNPMSYHNGSVWPHDNALIALGLARYGMKLAAERVFNGLFEAASYMEFRRLPELFCGFRRVRSQAPTLYPVACTPQAWSCVTPFAMIGTLLGLEFDPVERLIKLHNPRLPEFLDEVVLSNLLLGQTSLDLSVHRHGNDISLQVIRSDGHIQVSSVHT